MPSVKLSEDILAFIRSQGGRAHLSDIINRMQATRGSNEASIRRACDELVGNDAYVQGSYYVLWEPPAPPQAAPTTTGVLSDRDVLALFMAASIAASMSPDAAMQNALWALRCLNDDKCPACTFL